MDDATVADVEVVDTDECRRLQEEEILAMQAIYPETFKVETTTEGTFKGSLVIDLVFDIDKLLLLHSVNVYIPPTPPNSSDEKALSFGESGPGQVANASPIRVKTLPPITVHFEMPSTYPLGSALIITSWECIWWNGLLEDEQAELKDEIVSRLDDFWNSTHEAMLYETEQIIKDMDSLFPLNLVDVHVDVQGDVQVSDIALSQILIDFNSEAEREEFSRAIFKCGICLDEKRGKDCRKLIACGHVFCKGCIDGYFSTSITEGAIAQVRCPDSSCLRFPRRLNRSELLAIVGKEQVTRLEWLEEKARNEADPTMTYCPRKNCGGAVKKETTSEKLGICLDPKCGYAFCLYCKKTWHGNYRYCKLEDVNSLVREYKDGDPSKREALELRYGKKTIAKMIQTFEEEALNDAWKAENATSCSNLLASILIIFVTFIVYGVAVEDWPPGRQVLNPDVLTVEDEGEIHLHQNWKGKWRLAFNTQWPDVTGYPTKVSSNVRFQVIGGPRASGDGGGTINVNLLELSKDQKLGMDHVTDYMDVELSGQPPMGSLPMIKLYYNAPLHLAYIQRLGQADDYPRLAENPFFYVNPTICSGGTEALFRAWRAKWQEPVIQIAQFLDRHLD